MNLHCVVGCKYCAFCSNCNNCFCSYCNNKIITINKIILIILDVCILAEEKKVTFFDFQYLTSIKKLSKYNH